jgi:anti-sigma regulatory factor (Ser/Thr protein kinase)
VAGVSALFSRRYPADPESVRVARHAVLDALSAAGFRDADLHFKVALALTEATANVVRHAYPHNAGGFLDVIVDRTADGVVISVADHGGGMDTNIGVPGLGVGLAIMRAQTTSLGVESDTSGTVVTLHFGAHHDLA